MGPGVVLYEGERRRSRKEEAVECVLKNWLAEVDGLTCPQPVSIWMKAFRNLPSVELTQPTHPRCAAMCRSFPLVSQLGTRGRGGES